jgi:DNA-binding transcriptional LysR family regulator
MARHYCSEALQTGHCQGLARCTRLHQLNGAIRALEERHGIVLFYRVGRRIELTGTGREFLNQAREVLRVAGAAELSLFELRGLKRGTVHLACQPDHRRLLAAATAGPLSCPIS